MLEVGDIIATKGDTFLSRVVRWFTKGNYSHIAIVYDVFDDYVVVGEINWSYTYCTRELSYKDYDVYRYDGEVNKRAIQHGILKMGGLKYDFLDIFRIVFCMPMKYTPSRLICSEAIDVIYKNCGCDLNIETECPTPEQIVNSEKLKKIS